MPISINQISSGMGIKLDGNIFVVLEAKHVKPGKGGAFVRAKLKNLKTDQILERTIKPADKFEEIHLEEKKLQNLYQTGADYHFMDLNTFEETVVPGSVLGDDVKFLQDNAEVKGLCYKGKVLQVELPIFIKAQITHTEPGLKGDSSKAGTKPATIDTGATIQVPLFINTGDWVKVDTRSGEYVERHKA